MLEDKTPQRTSLSQLGEFGLIEHLTKNFDVKQSSTLKSIGDDAAVLDFKDKKAIVSTDLLIEGVHFDLSYMPLRHLGYKAVVVNVSDICAMNARATQITVSVAVSNRFPLEALEELFDGIALAAKFYNLDVIGGDTTSSQKGMVIGSGAKMIKKIGMEARTEIEKLMETKVRLELHVKVDHKWTKDPKKLAKYGYHLK